MITPELAQMRYVVEVADQRSFSAAADCLHVAQPALRQQIRTVEIEIGVQLFHPEAELTPAGVVFVDEARRLIAAADRVVARAQAVSRGQAGRVRIAYTLATAHDTLPAIMDAVEAAHPEIRLELREVLGVDVADLLSDARFDAALCPRTGFGPDFRRREVRREPFLLAITSAAEDAGDDPLDLANFARERFALWPRDMAPGYYDAVIAACREAGFEPRVDDHAAGSEAWTNIAEGHAVGLVVGSVIEELAPGVTLRELKSPPPTLVVDLVWHPDTSSSCLEQVLAAAQTAAYERGWTIADPATGGA